MSSFSGFGKEGGVVVPRFAYLILLKCDDKWARREAIWCVLDEMWESFVTHVKRGETESRKRSKRGIEKRAVICTFRWTFSLALSPEVHRVWSVYPPAGSFSDLFLLFIYLFFVIQPTRNSPSTPARVYVSVYSYISASRLISSTDSCVLGSFPTHTHTHGGIYIFIYFYKEKQVNQIRI